MATKKKTRGKTKAKRKKTPATKPATRKKAKTVKKDLAKKAARALGKKAAPAAKLTHRKAKTVKEEAAKKASRKKAKSAAKVVIKGMPSSPPKPAAETPIPPAQVAPPEERIGVVTHYYNHLSVAIMRLDSGTLRVGDVIHIRGHTTDFRQRVESLEINHSPAIEVRPGDDFGLKVTEHAREHDVVYKV